jgi:DNA-binding winged helix-turn-helix (wHTH) protein
MISYNSNRKPLDRAESRFAGTDSRTSAPRSMQLQNSFTRPGQHVSVVRRTRMPATVGNGIAEVMADIDGLPVVFRVLVKDLSARMQSDSVSEDADINSLLSSTLQTLVDGMRGSSLRTAPPSKQPLAIVELTSSREPAAELPAPSNQTVLQVGALELDLLDRTAKRGDRKIDLRPREFQLLKYMMQRGDKLLTRAILFKEVWHYKFVPETNLVDVHMGRLRRKVDGPNEAPMIRNVRGAGFVLSATPVSQHSSTTCAEPSTNLVTGNKPPLLLERPLQ